MNSDDIVDIGEEHHRAGRLQEAELHYRKALEIDPGHPGALFYLANIAYSDGRLQLAAQLIETLLRDEPNDAEAWYLLGMVSAREENPERAVESLKKAVALQPAYAQAHYDLGMILGRQENIDPAIEHLQRAVALNPNFIEANLALGNVYRAQNKFDEAMTSYQRVIDVKGNVEAAYLGMGQIQVAQKKLDEAISIFRLGLLKIENSAALHHQLAMAFMADEQYDEAIREFRHALTLDRSIVDAHLNLGNCLIHLRRFDEAEAAYKGLVEQAPEHPRTHVYLAMAHIRLGKLTEAFACWQKAIALDPDCVEAHHYVLNFMHYFPEYSREQIFERHVAFGERFETPLQKERMPFVGPDPHKRLRVGFVSADLYCHPVSFFLESVLRELYRQNRIDIVVYATNSRVDAWTERMRAYAHSWFTVFALSDEATAQKIREDNIDILIDLTGHNPDNRLLMFARKPAPIQATWLGYWDTTGLRAIDYILCDRYSVHDGDEKFLVEQPWFLPHSRLCFTAPNQNIPVAPLPALGNGHLTFGCFNSSVKITDRVILLWSKILKRISNAHLILNSPSFGDENIRENIKSRFVAEGVSAERLKLESGAPYGEHFFAYNRVDIALDPFPFPGGATSTEGLWMGVPFITLQGDRIISRQGEGMLRNLGMQDWIAKDEDDYVELAVQKSENLTGLSKLRGELRGKLLESPLCDAKKFAGDLNDAFEAMWKQHCKTD